MMNSFLGVSEVKWTLGLFYFTGFEKGGLIHIVFFNGGSIETSIKERKPV